MVKDCNLEFVRAEDHVEYFLFPHITTEEGPANNNLRTNLEVFLKSCNEVAQRLVSERNYIWHKDEFHLQIRTGETNEKLLRDDHTTNPTNDEMELPPHLYGVTHYGDNLNDEWFIVFLLLQITKEVSGSIARVIDSDGEFLLIEAADVLPNWASPDTCEQRVYICDGYLQLVQNSPSNTSKPIAIATAVSKIQANPTLYRVSKEIHKLINNRLKEFSEFDPKVAFHNQIVKLPVTAAALLKEHPRLIASAVRAFCERDVIDMKACRSMRFFSPEQPQVRTSVRFTRCLYAMLMSSNYTPERRTGWNLTNSKDSEEYKEELLGIKIACGFEILASAQAKTTTDDNSDENNPLWKSYVQSLKTKGYFRDNMEGSKDYKLLLDQAKIFFESNNEGIRTVSTVGKEILQLLQNVDINAQQKSFAGSELKPSDSDDWMNISPEQLDAMLTERYGTCNLYQSEDDINPDEFAKKLTDFLSKQSGLEGIGDSTESATDDEDSDAASAPTKRSNLAKRKEEFKARVKKTSSMRKACKRNSLIKDSNDADSSTKASCSHDSQQTAQKGEANEKNSNRAKSSRHTGASVDESSSTQVRDFLEFHIPEDNWNSNSEMSDYEDELDLERNIEAMTNTDMKLDADIQAYMKQMDQELARTTIGQTFAGVKSPKTKKAQKPVSDDDDDDFDDIESFEPININVATLKNMMDSYKSQLGGSGPVTHLLNAMGMGMSAASGSNKAASPSMHEDDDVQLDDLKESTV